MPHDEIENQKFSYMKVRAGEINNSKKIVPGIVCDYDKNGRLLGIEYSAYANTSLAEMLSVASPTLTKCVTDALQYGLEEIARKWSMTNYRKNTPPSGIPNVSEVTGEDFYIDGTRYTPDECVSFVKGLVEKPLFTNNYKDGGIIGNPNGNLED